MKIIINESQLRLIVENEGKDNLINFTPFYNSADPNDWDDMFLHLNKKKGGIYDGYYIDGDVYLQEFNVTKLDYLVIVGGRLNLNHSPIKSLPMLEYVGGYLDLYGSQIESLLDGLYVGGYLDIGDTQLSDNTTEKDLRDMIKVKKNIFL
jgi:hypothetical protein